MNEDGSITFTITPPEQPNYDCYRIVMEYGIYTEERITYDLELTLPKPKISGTYSCWAVGYGEEGQRYSKESNLVTLLLPGEGEEFVPPYRYTEEGLPDVTHTDAGKILMVDEAGKWVAQTLVNGNEVAY